MGVFAWRNLMTRPLRTALALIGLSIPILGVMGLFSLSRGLRNMVGDTLSQVEGLMVLRENAPSPVFSDLPRAWRRRLRKIPGVRVVAPEVWKVAPNIEGQGMLSGLMRGKGAQSIFDQPVIQGQDIEAHHRLKSAVYPRAIKENGEGRFLDPADKGTNRHRHQPEDRPRPPRRRRQAEEGGRHAPDRRQAVHDRRPVRDRVDAPGRRHRHGHRDRPEAAGALRRDGLELSTSRRTTRRPTTRPRRRSRQAVRGVDARSMNEFMANFGR